MISTRFIQNVVYMKTELLKRNVAARILRSSNCMKSTMHSKNDVDENEDDFDKPIKYSTTKAAKWLASESRDPNKTELPYQGQVISLSLAVFLIYFAILREENDIDLLLDRVLPEHIRQNMGPNLPHNLKPKQN